MNSRRSLVWFCIAMGGLMLATEAATATSRPVINAVPFEPPYEVFFRWDDKFAHPPEGRRPEFPYPFEMRRGGGSGEVVVLVQIDAEGAPQKLSVLYATHPIFMKSALDALTKARWMPEPNRFGRTDTCFYYKAVYSVD